MNPGELYNQTPEDFSPIDRIIAACQLAIDSYKAQVLRFTPYGMLCAICPMGASQREVMKYAFALIHAKYHFRGDDSPSELVYPSGPAFLLQCVPDLCFLFTTQAKVARVHEFIDGTFAHLLIDVLFDREKPQHQSSQHNHIVCHECVRYCHRVLGCEIPKSCVDAFVTGGDNDPTHAITLRNKLLHLPPPPFIILATIMCHNTLFDIGVLMQLLLHELPKQVLFDIALLASRGMVERVISTIYTRYIGFRDLTYPTDFLPRQNIMIHSKMMGLFNPELQSLSIDETRRRVATMHNIIDNAKVAFSMKMPFLTMSGTVSIQQAMETFQGAVEIGQHNIEALSIACVSGVVWMLNGLNTHTSNVRLQSLWIGPVLELLAIPYATGTSGEHATCTQCNDVFVKWQFVYSYEIARIAQLAVDTGDDDKFTAKNVLDSMTTDELIQKIIRIIKPTHTVTLRDGSSIAREYENYHRMRNDPEFFCYPVFGVMTTTRTLITSDIKVMADTHFRTELAELALVTVYPNYGLTLNDIMTISVIHNPVKIITTLCLLFLHRYQATGGRVWPDAHTRNWTLRPAPKPVSITHDGMTISFITGEQMVCAIDHGDDTPSRVADVGAACKVFNDTIREIIKTHNHDFVVVAVKAEDLQPHELYPLDAETAKIFIPTVQFSRHPEDLRTCTYGLYRRMNWKNRQYYSKEIPISVLVKKSAEAMRKCGGIDESLLRFASSDVFKAVQIMLDNNSIDSIKAALARLYPLIRPQRQPFLVKPLVG